MTLRRAQLTHPDIHIDEWNLPYTWPVLFQLNGAFVDVRESALEAMLFNNSRMIGNLVIGRENGLNGQVDLTLTPELYDHLGVYSTWILTESTVLDIEYRGRIVRDR